MIALAVVVPAHDEESTIGDAVRTILTAEAEIGVTVVANGCTDATADAARSAHPRVEVIEIDTASKIGALNALQPPTDTPVAYVDADVTVSGATLLELTRRLHASPAGLVAAPRLIVVPSDSWWVRQYYRVWALTDYRTTGHIGSGIYLLMPEGRSRFGEFPDVIADDLFVQRLFADHERLTPADLTFAVRAPGSLRALSRRAVRIAAGNLQLADEYPELAPPRPAPGARALVKRVARHPDLWVGFAVYSAVYAQARVRANAHRHSRRPIGWNRDDTTRTGRR